MNVELFACAGGMAEGFRRAGVHFDLVIDKDANARASYEANLGHAPIGMDVRDFLRIVQAGWRPPRPIDLFVADPPCTPWSNAGKREGLSDERDCLRETVELIRLLRPSTYLIGNVPGLATAPNIRAVHETIGSLARDGYCVADAAVLDAADYGVPQRRVRPFWFGHLEGPCLRWPAPSHRRPPCSHDLFEEHALPNWVTCREALAHLSASDLGRPVRVRIRPSVVRAKDTGDGTIVYTGEKKRGSRARARRAGHPPTRPNAPAKTQTTWSSGGSSTIFFGDDHRPTSFDEPARTITSSPRGHGDGCVLMGHPRHPFSRVDEPAMTLRGGDAGSPDRVLRVADDDCDGTDVWPWDRPATTVMSDDRLAPPGHYPESGSWLSSGAWGAERPATTVMAGNPTIGGPGKGSICKRPNAVKISERAAAILQGFPDGWVFVGRTKAARWSQIGQAMPPGLAHAVARAIVDRARAKESAA